MKIFLLLTLIAVTVISCGTPKTVIQSKKEIKGYWNLTNISYSEEGDFNVSMFDIATKECFEGSSWKFIPNNNTGNYNFAGADCPTEENYFIFTIQEMDQATGLYDFLLKPTNAKKKSATNAGYRLQLTQLSETAMQWKQTLNVDGEPFTITMNFTKQL